VESSGRAEHTPPAPSGPAGADDVRGILRAQLSSGQRELDDLGYLNPTGPAFALNTVTRLALAARQADDAAAPLLTLFAQPVTAETPPVELARVLEWLEPNRHRYAPLPGALFVPNSNSRRGIADGVLASSSSAGLYTRFLVIRRSGSVELGPASVWQNPQGERRWIVDSKKLVAQYAQLLGFLRSFGAEFKRPGAWRVLLNIRNAQRAALGHFAEGWAPAFDYHNETTLCLEPHVQLDFTFSDTEEETEDRIREFATRLELAFGFWKPRVYNERTGVLELADVTY
jgi:hypothetical protein